MRKPYERGLIVGKFMPPHFGHMYLIEEAAKQCDILYVLVYSNPDPPKFNSERRKALIMQHFVERYGMKGPHGCTMMYRSARDIDAPFDFADDYTQRETLKRYIEGVRSMIKYPDVVFTSEDYGPGFAEHLGVDHVMIDKERNNYPISGTKARSDIYANFPMLPPVTRKFYRGEEYIEKVVFLGAESTGKSTIAKRMAEEYDTNYTHEVGRDICEGTDHKLTSHDMAHIVCEQEILEETLMQQGKCKHYLFCDTNALTTLFYSYEYNDTAPMQVWSAAQRVPERYQHVFLCDTDIPFEDDGTRRLSGQAHELHDSMVRMQLDWMNIEYTVLRGNLEQRVRTVKNILEYRKQCDFYLPTYTYRKQMERALMEYAL